jgi:hypothetical protein
MNPGMKEAYYFSHDSNAQHDPKMIKLIYNLGWEGYGLYWGIVERLRNEKDYCMPTDYECIAMAMRTECERIQSIIEDFNLFVIEDDYFYSKSLLERMKLREIKSEKARESAYKRWNKDANAMRVQCDSNAIKESKRKEKKGKEIPLDSKESDKKMTLIEYYGIAFEKCFNEIYHANFGKDGHLLKDLEKHYGYDKVIANIDYFFEHYIINDDFAMENPHVGTFHNKWNSIASKRSGKKSLTRGEKKIVTNAENIIGATLE